MICRKCRFKEFCYAANSYRKKCDPLAQRWTIQYYYFVGVMSLLESDKQNADADELIKIENDIEDFEYCCMAVCEYMSEGQRTESEPLFQLSKKC